MTVQSRSGFVRMAALAVVGAGTLAAAAACGGSSTSTSGTGAASAPSASASASASSTGDPLASLTGTQVATQAVADAKAATSLTLTGNVTDSGGTYAINLGFKPGQGCTGTMGVGNKGSVKIIVIGTTVYLNPDPKFWRSNAGSQANAVIALVNGRYIKASTSTSSMASLAKLCDLSQVLGSLKVTGTVTKGPVTTLDGNQVLQLKDSKGGVMYVTDTSKPQIVKLVGPQGSGELTVSVGAPVTLTAPPASQVIDGSQLGF